MAQHRIIVQLSASEQRLLAMLSARQQCQRLPATLRPSPLEVHAWAPMDGPDVVARQGSAPQPRDRFDR